MAKIIRGAYTTGVHVKGMPPEITFSEVSEMIERGDLVLARTSRVSGYVAKSKTLVEPYIGQYGRGYSVSTHSDRRCCSRSYYVFDGGQ